MKPQADFYRVLRHGPEARQAYPRGYERDLPSTG